MLTTERITLPYDLKEFTHIIDVRSPSEFAEDHIPGAINLPALSNDQRAEVGTLDKQVSPFHARRLGARYITENISKHLATSLADHDKNFAPLVYCWRGGLRSASVATILRSIGWRARTIDGGYKAYRKYVMLRLEEKLNDPALQFHTLAGLTGTGKTRLLHALHELGAQVLDLEKLANHRGSLLGNHPNSPQPTQRLFETQLLTALESFDYSQPIWTEAESSRIGKIQCPSPLWERLHHSIVYEIQVPIEARTQLLREDYEHFLENTPSLAENLNYLRRVRGHEQVDAWLQQIEQRDWVSFLSSILLDHYDLTYRRPGEGSNYATPTTTLSLTDLSSTGLKKTAAELHQQ